MLFWIKTYFQHGYTETIRFAIFSIGMWFHRKSLTEQSTNKWWDTKNPLLQRSLTYRISQHIKAYYHRRYQ